MKISNMSHSVTVAYKSWVFMHILSQQCKCLVWLYQFALLLCCGLFVGGGLVRGFFLVLLSEVGDRTPL